MLWCSMCQTEAPTGKKFCKLCGAQLTEKTEPPPGSQAEIACSSCGQPVFPESKFCKKCGYSLGSPRPAETVSEAVQGSDAGVTARSAPASLPALHAPAMAQAPPTQGKPPSPPQPPFGAAAKSAIPAPRSSWNRQQILMGTAALAVLVLAGLGWYFRASLPGISGLIRPSAAVGWATVAVPDTPVFTKATREADIVSLLPPGQRVELLTLPEKAGDGGKHWVRVRWPEKRTGYLEWSRLQYPVGVTDAAQYQILLLQLHAEDSPHPDLDSDIGLLRDFLRRFPASPFSNKMNLALANRFLQIARQSSSDSSPGGPDFTMAYRFSQSAAELYANLARTSTEDSDRQLASHGREEAQQIASFSDAKLNPSPTAQLSTDQTSVYRGQAVRLTWSTTNAARARIEPGIGTVASEGSKMVYPTEDTTYRLVADGTRTQAQSLVHVSVNTPPPTVSLRSDASTVQRGQPVSLEWSSTDATELSLNPTPGSVGPSGRTQVYPTQTGPYRLLARGLGGSAESQVYITVVEPPRYRSISVPAGTDIAIQLIDSLDSSKTPAGQVFHASLEQPIIQDGRTLIPKSVDVYGRVMGVSPSGRASGVAQMTLILFQVRVGNQVQTIYTDTMNFKAKSERGKDAAKIAAGSAIGAVIGAIAGGGKGAAIGAGAGAGAGTGVVLATKGKEIQLPSETVLHFRLAQPLTFQVQE